MGRHDFDAAKEIDELKIRLGQLSQVILQQRNEIANFNKQIGTFNMWLQRLGDVEFRFLRIERFLPLLQQKFAGEIGPEIPENVLGIFETNLDGIAPNGQGFHFGPIKAFDLQNPYTDDQITTLRQEATRGTAQETDGRANATSNGG